MNEDIRELIAIEEGVDLFDNYEFTEEDAEAYSNQLKKLKENNNEHIG